MYFNGYYIIVHVYCQDDDYNIMNKRSFKKLSHYTTTAGLYQMASLSNSSVINSRSCIFSASSPILPLAWDKNQEEGEDNSKNILELNCGMARPILVLSLSKHTQGSQFIFENVYMHAK